MALREVVVAWYREVTHEGEDAVRIVAEAVEQVAGFALLAAALLVMPVPLTTQFHADPGPPPVGMRNHQIANPLESGFAPLSSLYNHDIDHG